MLLWTSGMNFYNLAAKFLPKFGKLLYKYLRKFLKKTPVIFFFTVNIKTNKKFYQLGRVLKFISGQTKCSSHNFEKKTGSQKLYAKSPEKNGLENWIKNNKEKFIWRIKVSSRKYCWHRERSFETWPTLYIEYSEELLIKFQEKI